MSTTVDRPFDSVVTEVRSALAQQGFGVITEIDMQATLLNKLGEEIGSHVILGACSPSHAFRALQAEPGIGLLLPCNVVVRADESGTVVEVINPEMLVDLTANAEMTTVADEVTASLKAVLD
ncbi:MAG: DUF302 domain-containing protein, partial [Candidatus Nanopelagicales bacterium]|nr:DUF302 domain-containing protein [Candidatus Nanopelagicales bacterium]